MEGSDPVANPAAGWGSKPVANPAIFLTTVVREKKCRDFLIKNFVSCSDFFSSRSEMLPGFSMLQSIFTSFFPARSLNFLCFIKNYPACMPVTCKKSRQFRLGLVNTTFENCMLYKIRPVNIAAKKCRLPKQNF